MLLTAEDCVYRCQINSYMYIQWHYGLLELLRLLHNLVTTWEYIIFINSNDDDEWNY